LLRLGAAGQRIAQGRHFGRQAGGGRHTAVCRHAEARRQGGCLAVVARLPAGLAA
jgi:hypothetical protein